MRSRLGLRLAPAFEGPLRADRFGPVSAGRNRLERGQRTIWRDLEAIDRGGTAHCDVRVIEEWKNARQGAARFQFVGDAANFVDDAVSQLDVVRLELAVEKPRRIFAYPGVLEPGDQLIGRHFLQNRARRRSLLGARAAR